MITGKKTASEVASAGERFVEALSMALREIEATGTPAEVERFKRAVGSVVGNLELDLLWPIYKQHPELEPENLRDNANDI